MISKTMAISLAALMALGAGAPLAQAQPDQAPSGDSTAAQAQQTYQDQQDHYRNAQAQYQDQTADYAAKRAAYERERHHFEHERDVYDERFGAGAFVRYYHEHRAEYDERYGPGAYDRDFGGPPPEARAEARYDAYRDYRDSPCERRATGDAVGGGVIGALAGAAIGSSVGGGGGVVLGALVGGATGAAIGHGAAQCDREGYYFAYDETYPYREGDWEARRSGEYGYEYYSGRHCRLAEAPAYWHGGMDYRYVRVCPDDRGRYRITN
jgi:hypothetical protein